MSNKSVEQIKDDLNKSKIENQAIIQELKNSFLEYAMSVIVARAIPDARDGLKPVHRRVLFAAYGLGLSSSKPHKKSARIVGEVIGKYHPHGDTAAYETMVRMAQNFSMRYTLIDGHGNFGSTDDGPAAMRYTEARLSKLGDELLNDIDKETVNWLDNYDGTEKEPEVLTCSLPNLLANGCSGIAVGMATNIPPHNLSELIAAIKIIAHTENPRIDDGETINKIKEVLHGPDFPTGAELIGIDGIDSYLRTGHGSLTIRAKTEIEVKENKSKIIVKELPYLTSKKSLIDKIVELVENKQIEGISDLQDYSNKDGIHIEISVKRDVIPEVLLNNLYKTTPLQTSFAVNMMAIVDGTPRILNIIDALNIYLKHQIVVLINKTKFELKKAKEREHILLALHIATTDIDKVIKIIRGASDNDGAIANLISELNIDEIQAKAITEMKLRSLSGLEKQKIENELEELKKLIISYDETLSSHDKQISIIEQQLDYLDKKFGDDRRTTIRHDISSSISDEDLIPKEDILITLSNNSYLKRLPIDTFHTQKRGGVGIIGTQTHDDDEIKKIIVANTHVDLLIFTDFGKVYKIRGHHIPMGSRIFKGIPAINIIQIEKTEHVLTIVPISEYTENEYLFFCTTNGVVKRTKLSEFNSVHKNGKIAITLKEGDKLFDVVKITDNDANICIGSDNGKIVQFPINSIRTLSRTSMGVFGMKLDKNEKVVGLAKANDNDLILSIGDKGVGKLTEVAEFRATKRNAKGVKAMKVNEKTGHLLYTGSVKGNEDVLIITSSGKVIRFPISSLHAIGRNSSGVRLIRCEGKEKVKSVTIFEHNENTTDEDIKLEVISE